MSLFFVLKILAVLLPIFLNAIWSVGAIIERAVEATSGGTDAALQMQVIRRIMEDVYGGSWGVLIIKNPALISLSVHWTIPDHHNSDGSPAFCLHVYGEEKWQYNVFKIGDVDTDNRLTVEEVINRVNEKLPPERLSVAEFDRKVADVFVQKRRQISRRLLSGTSGITK